MQNRPNPVQLGVKNLLKASSRAPANRLEGSVQRFKRPQTATVWGRFFLGQPTTGHFFVLIGIFLPKQPIYLRS